MTSTRWWHWVIGTYAILVIWLFGGPIMAVAMNAVLGNPVGGWQELLVQLSTFIPFFIATPLVWRYLLKRPIAELVRWDGRARWGRIGYGFTVWFGLAVTSSGLNFVLAPDAYDFTFSLGAFIPFLVVALLLLPIQTSAEEFFFRGWLIRWAERRSTLVIVMISGTVFALPHLGNPEAKGHELAALAAWFVLGAGWAYVSVRDQGIELALGAHLANNLFAILFVAYGNAALPTSAVVTTPELNLDATAIAISVLMALFIFLTRPRT